MRGLGILVAAEKNRILHGDWEGGMAAMMAAVLVTILKGAS